VLGNRCAIVRRGLNAPNFEINVLRRRGRAGKTGGEILSTGGFLLRRAKLMESSRRARAGLVKHQEFNFALC
jgi:hypothetical protein